MSEFLSRDILQEGYVRSFAPFRLVQLVLGSCRVDARDLFVTPPTVRQKIYTVIINIVILFCFKLLLDLYKTQGFEHTNIYYFCLASIAFDYTVYSASVFHVRFVNNGESVKFFNKLQEIDRKLNIDKTSYLYGFLFKLNVATICATSLIDWIIMAVSLFENVRMTFYRVAPFLSQVTFMTELMDCSNTVLFFYTRINCINSIIMSHLNLNHDSYDKTCHLMFLDEQKVMEIVSELNDFRDGNIVECLKEILDALRTFTSLYRFQVRSIMQIFLFCLRAVMQTVLIVQFFILTTQNNLQVTQERIILPVKWSCNVVVLIVICLRWQKFCGEMDDTKHLCTTVIATHKGPIRKKAARIIKIIEGAPPRFSVYDMWDLDASLLLKMFNIMTTVIITLFQFALM